MSSESDVKLRLHYFNFRGRAELIRYILKYAGREFEDIRFSREDWPNHKSKYPAGQVPVLEFVKDGKSHYLTQSITIARALARKHNLVGGDDREAAQCDEVADCISDLINMAVLAFKEPEAERKEKIKNRLKTEEYPRVLGFLERKVKENGGKHIVGSSWTWADFAVSLFITGINKYLGENSDDFSSKLPGLCALAQSVEKIPAIAAWIKERPESLI